MMNSTWLSANIWSIARNRLGFILLAGFQHEIDEFFEDI